MRRHRLTDWREGQGAAGSAVLVAAGIAAVAASVAARPTEARAAAAQVWPPFVLVTGLLLVGLVADADGLFSAAGRRLARTSPGGVALFAGTTAVVGLVTAVLNLDTAVAFLTPVLVYTARSGRLDEAPQLYGVLLLANAGSLFLPGSNLTNLIVLGHLHWTGGQFLARMWAPATGALVVTAFVVALVERRALRKREPRQAESAHGTPTIGLGLLAVALSVVLVLVLRRPAPAVFAVGVVAVVTRSVTDRHSAGQAVRAIGVPVLIGLFGVAVALGTLGRAWSGPATLLGHLDLWGTAAVAAVASVLCNNLPAASLLAARTPSHPLALLIGLNVGPNLFVSGSLAWILWLRAARSAGAAPSVWRAARIGLVAVPLAVAVSVGLLGLVGNG